jgi:hypothetical protein
MGVPETGKNTDLVRWHIASVRALQRYVRSWDAGLRPRRLHTLASVSTPRGGGLVNGTKLTIVLAHLTSLQQHPFRCRNAFA